MEEIMATLAPGKKLIRQTFYILINFFNKHISTLQEITAVQTISFSKSPPTPASATVWQAFPKWLS